MLKISMLKGFSLPWCIEKVEIEVARRVSHPGKSKSSKTMCQSEKPTVAHQKDENNMARRVSSLQHIEIIKNNVARWKPHLGTSK